MITLSEELLLIFIDDASGTIAARDALQYALAGAILSDLAQSGKVHTKDMRLVAIDSGPMKDEILDRAFATIMADKKPHTIKYWIGALGEQKLIQRTANKLVAKNILRLEKKHYLWVIPYETYLQQNASVKELLKRHLRAVVLGGENPDAHTVALLSLLNAARMLNMVFALYECTAAEAKIEELSRGDTYSEAVAQTLEEINAEALANVMAATAV